MMGAIADRTNTRWGKFRPWMLWTAVPFGVMGFLTFITPDLGTTGKLVYAYVTYMLLMIVYSMNNLPYSALSGVMTGDIGERTSLSSYRFVCAMIAAAPHPGACPAWSTSSAGRTARRLQVTMGIFSVLAVVFFFITFATTKERIQPDRRSRSATDRQDLADLARNGPWLALFALTFFVFITLAMRGGVCSTTSGTSSAARASSAPSTCSGLGATIVGILFSKALAMRFGKRDVFIAGLLAHDDLSRWRSCLCRRLRSVRCSPSRAVRQFVYGFTIPLLWAMMADVADYSEWKNRRRATGIVFAGSCSASRRVSGSAARSRAGSWPSTATCRTSRRPRGAGRHPPAR